MGRGGRAANSQWSEEWPESQPVRYWRGSWGPSRATEQATQYQFPRYDAANIPARLAKGKGKHTETSEAEQQDPDGTIVPDMQELLNHTRRAEQKVRQLTKQREAKGTQWKVYVAKMKKAYLDEQQRHGRDLQRITEELAKAIAAQDEARAQIRHMAHCITEGIPPPVPANTADNTWDTMMNQWQEERQQDGPQAVLERAIAAGKERRQGPMPMETEAHSVPSRAGSHPVAPDEAAKHYMAPPAPDNPRIREAFSEQPPPRVPYQGSPHPLHGIPSPSPPPRTRTDPEPAAKTKPRPGPYSPVPGAPSVEKKLAARRAAEEAAMTARA